MKIGMHTVYGFIVGIIVRYPVGVILAAALGVAFSLLVTATQLEFHTSRLDLIATGERYKQLDQAYSREFEDLPERVIVVIRSDHPETAKAFATALAQRWEMDPTIDKVWYRIDVEALKRKALFYLSPDDLVALRQKLQEHQDLLQELVAAPTLQNLFALINREITAKLVGHVFTGFLEEEGKKELPDLSLLLALLQAMQQWLEGRHPYRSPWERWFTQDTDTFSHDGFLWSDDKHLLFVLADPKAQAGDFNRFKQGVQQIRADVRALRQAYPDVEVGITGRAVLESDEMAVAQRDMTIASLLSLLGVAGLFVAFYRGLVRPALTILTLIVGVGWSLGFTSLVVGHLNIFTIVFGPMLIGLGIDYGIHFTSRYAAERAHGWSVRDALERTMTGTGPGLVAAALTTAAAFYLLLLTGFKGLGELGVITGSGLLLILLATLTCLPALLALEERRRHLRTTPERLQERARGSYLAPLYRYPRITLAASAVLVGLSLLGLGRVGWDFNLLRLQAEGTESVIWVQRIFASAQRSVLFGKLMAESLEEVKRKAAALKALPSVAKVESLASVIPEDQERKLPLIRALRPFLADIALPGVAAESVDLEALRAVLGRIAFKMVEEEGGDAEDEGRRAEMREVRHRIDQVVATMEQLGEAKAVQALSAFQAELFQDLAEKLAILQASVTAEPISIADVPSELRRRYIGKTGQYQLFVFPSEDIWEYQLLARFVADLQAVDPAALGSPVMNFAYLRTIKEGYEKAGLYAALGTVALTFLTFRGLGPTLLALIPLSVGALWTVGLIALFQVEFNVANLLLVPLLMGIGIDNGIHVVHRFFAAARLAEARVPLARSTGLAIALSSLTTMVGFGSLMISRHRGMFSLGLLITLGVGSVLLASVMVLPSVLALLPAQGGGKRPAPSERLTPVRQPERCDAAPAGATTKPIAGGSCTR